MFGKQLDQFFRDGYTHFGEVLQKRPNFTLEFMIPGCKGLDEDIQKFKEQFSHFTNARGLTSTPEETDKFYNDNVLRLYRYFKGLLNNELHIEDDRVVLYLTPALPLLSLAFFDMEDPYSDESYVRVKPLLPFPIGNYDIPQIDVYKSLTPMFRPYEQVWNELKYKGSKFNLEDRW
jgi:hypothetical protein